MCVYVEGLGLNITKTWGFIEIGGGGGVEGGGGWHKIVRADRPLQTVIMTCHFLFVISL